MLRHRRKNNRPILRFSVKRIAEATVVRVPLLLMLYTDLLQATCRPAEGAQHFHVDRSLETLNLSGSCSKKKSSKADGEIYADIKTENLTVTVYGANIVTQALTQPLTSTRVVHTRVL